MLVCEVSAALPYICAMEIPYGSLATETVSYFINCKCFCKTNIVLYSCVLSAVSIKVSMCLEYSSSVS